ncbi:MAG: TolC family outer membrane protein [Rhodospirillales bacterium]
MNNPVTRVANAGRSIFCAVVALPCLLTTISPVKAEDIKEALSKAYLNNPTLQAERAGVRATDEGVPQALSNWRPSITASGDLTRQDTFSSTRAGEASSAKEQIRTPRGVELEITQPLFRGFRTLAATRKAENTVRAARAKLLSVEQTVLQSAAARYMDVVRDQAVLALNINNEQVLRRQLEATQDRFQVGEVTRTDVSQSEARLAGANADRIQAEGDLETTRAAYKNVVGAYPEKLISPSEKDLGAKFPKSKAEAMELAKDNHPDVLEALYNDRSARDNVAEIRGELLPTVNLFGSSAYREENNGNLSRRAERVVGAELSVPLYQSGSVYSRIRAAKQQASQNRILIEQARRNVIEAASRAWDTLVTTRARVKSFESQVNANQIALDGVRRENQVGSRTVLDVLDAEQELLNSRVSLVRAKRDVIVAIFDLMAATGQLTAGDLNLKASPYDPTKHYEEVRGKWFGASSSGGADANWFGNDGPAKKK